jgi:alkylhydroperoxidase/carboxymuconolactone decarboxylase family protein YurZ
MKTMQVNDGSAARSSVANELKAEFEAQHSYWRSEWDSITIADPEIFRAFAGLASAASSRDVLDPGVRELIMVAVNAAVTYLNADGVRAHIGNALRLGVSSDEITETLELASVLGIHSCTMTVPILIEELVAAGQEDVTKRALTDREAEIKEHFIGIRGYWTPTWEVIVRLHPEFLEAYLGYSSVPFKRNALSPKVKELIYIAIDVSATHLYEEGIRVHIQNALRHGATADEILAVCEQAALIVIATCELGFEILLDETKRSNSTPPAA